MPLGRADQGRGDRAAPHGGGRRGLRRAAIRCAALLCVAVTSACGSTAHRAATSTGEFSPSACHLTPKAAKQLAHAKHDLATLRTIAADQKRFSEIGTPEMQRATGKYLDDLTNSSLDPFHVNRMIDMGVSTVSGSCGQCFQMLEASRPIPQMKYDPHPC